MKQIIIHCRNEEIEAIEPIADKLRREGAAVRYLAIKWKERDNKADLALCPEHHLAVVEAMYEGHKNAHSGKPVPVRVLEADVAADLEPEAAPVAEAVAAVSPLAALSADPVALGLTPAPAPVEEAPVEEAPVEADPVAEAPAAEEKKDEEEEPKPHHPAPRRRK